MNKLKDKSSFLGKIRELYKNGLSKEAILKSLTENPAKIVKSETFRNLRKGSYANFLLFTEDLFSKDAVLQKIGWQEKFRGK
jgi:dihydroorotase-like cyclic amidohydrolase